MLPEYVNMFQFLNFLVCYLKAKTYEIFLAQLLGNYQIFFSCAVCIWSLARRQHTSTVLSLQYFDTVGWVF